MNSMRDRIENLRVRVATRYFIPEGDIAHVLGEQEIRQVISNDPTLHGLEVQKFVVLIRKAATKVLATLLLIGKEHVLVRDFLHRELYDTKLPLCQSQLEHSSVRERFLLEQYTVLAPMFERGAIHRRLNEACVLPYIQNDPLSKGEGAFGVVFRIEIHPSHQKLVTPADLTGSCPKTIFFARKEFKLTDTSESDFEAEKRALEMLLELNHSNIVRLLTTYAHGDLFNMIFPLAETTLFGYLRNGRAPNSGLERRALLKQVYNLSSGLNSIHNFHLVFDKLELRQIGYHHDLKPQNILVHDQTFQIADFGLARLKDIDESSKTDWRKGTRTYGPPESGEGSRVGRSHDMWSLGCILAEVVTFSILGPEGVAKFAQRRETEPAPNKFNDAYHDGTLVKEEVIQWLRELKEDDGFDNLLDRMLVLVTRLLDPNPITRPNSQKFVEEFATALSEDDIQASKYSVPRDEKLRTPLHEASAAGDLQSLKLNLNGTSPENIDRVREMDIDERLPIHLASQHGHPSVVSELLNQDPIEGIRSADVNGYTVLHSAAAGNHLSVVIVLLEWAKSSGVLIETMQRRDSKGKTALHVAVSHSYDRLIQPMLDTLPTRLHAKDMLQDRDDSGRTVVEIASRKDNFRMLSVLQEYDRL